MYKIEATGDGNLVIKIPMALRTLGGRRRIITPGAADKPPRMQSDNAVLTAFARAQHWQTLIDSGEFDGAAEIAKKLGVDQTYVSRMIRLTQISPKIVRLFLTGQAPNGLSLTKLIQPLPSDWTEQENILLA